MPLFLFSLLFGLSMDYQVFLLSRIKERYDETGDTREAVAHGLGRTAGIITGAAAIMVCVFGGMATGELVMFQQMGFGLAVAVLIDATVVRTIIVPAAMNCWASATGTCRPGCAGSRTSASKATPTSAPVPEGAAPPPRARAGTSPSRGPRSREQRADDWESQMGRSARTALRPIPVSSTRGTEGEDDEIERNPITRSMDRSGPVRRGVRGRADGTGCPRPADLRGLLGPGVAPPGRRHDRRRRACRATARPS